MAENTPAFQYYPADLISDPEVMFWDMEEVGCYWQLVTYLWLNGGNFEFNLENLRKLFRKKTQKTTEKLWKKIEKKFVCENGIVTHKRITKEIQRQAEWRLKSSMGGKKSAEKRAKQGKGGCGMVGNNIQPKGNTSTSSSTSSSTSVNYIQADIDLANKYFGMIKVNPKNPKQSEPNFESWADDIRKLREIDKHTIADIEKIMVWVQNDDFWCSNCLSPSSFRKKKDGIMRFDMLKKRMENNGNGKTKPVISVPRLR